MIGYLDLPSGISGDMFLGCLVDGGWPVGELRAMLGRLHLPSSD
jgi:pyridinium-3,5-bisthiocarboxylic acid mononucleotide nickel chelatase